VEIVPDLEEPPPPPDLEVAVSDELATPPDLQPSELGPNLPAGHACSSASDCSGPGAECDTTLAYYPGSISPAPGGYCSNPDCGNVGCGIGGYCLVSDMFGHGYCLGECSRRDQCQSVNPNNRCFTCIGNGCAEYLGQSPWIGTACLPLAASECDPTLAGTCNNTGACNRAGPDDVGRCLTTCTFDGTCPDDPFGYPQSCYFLNRRIDQNGDPTGDYFAGLVCLPATLGYGLDRTCRSITECFQGLECNYYNIGGGGEVCKQLCRNGMSDCTMGGTCQNAFLLATFNAGDIGLCL
jgi:hypothetical protein